MLDEAGSEQGYRDQSEARMATMLLEHRRSSIQVAHWWESNLETFRLLLDPNARLP
jgi:hypothetical protein